MKKYKMKVWVKVVFTLLIIVSSILLYRLLGILSLADGQNNLGKAFILVGWVWLVFGQIIMLYVMWEEE